jgi:two-component sensor histidine kinase
MPKTITEDFPIVITAMPANARHHKIAFRGFVILVFVVAIVMLANIQMAHVDAFIPITQTMMCITDLLTATVLFVQYSVQSHRALLALAAGFVFSGLFAFLESLAFPDAYVTGVLIGDGLNSSRWLFLCWHTAFPLAAIVYALLKDAGEAADRSDRSPGVTIGITIACVLAATAGLTWSATAGAAYLPSLYENAAKQTLFGLVVNGYLALLSVTAIALVFVRRRTILDQWLIVTLFAWLPALIVSGLLTVVRFTLGWYLARVYALFAGASLLFVLLTETLLLYTRLTNAVVLLRRSEQRQRVLVAELDHRVKNILAQVAAVCTSTRQESRSIDDFVQSLGGRIRSMAAAHNLLSKTVWQGAGLDALVRTELAPYTTGANVKISGSDVMLTTAETQAVGRALHELATNAAKYGALSTPSGQVSVSWNRKPDGPASTLIIEWRERGGPAVAHDIRPGYGTTLIRNLIPHELGGTVDFRFAAEGVNCEIEFPLEKISAQGS